MGVGGLYTALFSLSFLPFVRSTNPQCIHSWIVPSLRLVMCPSICESTHAPGRSSVYSFVFPSVRPRFFSRSVLLMPNLRFLFPSRPDFCRLLHHNFPSSCRRSSLFLSLSLVPFSCLCLCFFPIANWWGFRFHLHKWSQNERKPPRSRQPPLFSRTNPPLGNISSPLISPLELIIPLLFVN